MAYLGPALMFVYSLYIMCDDGLQILVQVTNETKVCTSMCKSTQKHAFIFKSIQKFAKVYQRVLAN